MLIVATIILDVAESFEGRKPSLQMVKRYLVNKIACGNVDEDCFRGKVIMKMRNVQVAVMGVGVADIF